MNHHISLTCAATRVSKEAEIWCKSEAKNRSQILKGSQEGGRSKGLTIVDSSKKNFIKETLCLGLGEAKRPRVLVLVFDN